MNKKIITLILVILISFCFISIVVADNTTNDNNNTTDHNKTIDKKVVKNKTTDKNKVTNKTNDKSKKNYIIAKGNGNNIPFSDGFRGFILDYSKPSASTGDEFKRVSTSTVSNSNALKQGIIESYKYDSAGQIGKIVSDFVKIGSSSSKAGKAAAASNEKISDHEVVKINEHTEAVFDFEVLKSVSGNESDYFAYKVSFRTINDESTNQTNNLTNTTNSTKLNHTSNITNTSLPINNATNSTFLKGLYDYLASLANLLYNSWKPIVDTLINDLLMIVSAIEGLVDLVNGFIAEMQSLIDALGKLLIMLESILKGLEGLLKLLSLLLDAIKQLINLIMSIVNFILELISAIIALIQQLLDLLFSLINFLLDLINQIIALIQAILDFLKSLGSFLIDVIGNAAIIIVAFVIFTIGAFVYNRIR